MINPLPVSGFLFWVYQIATYVTFNVIDDAAMLAFLLA
jgi:hypothetical protein